MLASASDEPVTTPFNRLRDARTQEATNPKVPILGSGIPSPTFPTLSQAKQSVKTDNLLLSKRETSLITKNALSSSKIFPITFSYLQKLYYTKVQKVIYRTNESIYKIALHSDISPGTRICWLQPRVHGWAILLGYGLDERLLLAIISAIRSQE
jgi:hypothetical protein